MQRGLDRGLALEEGLLRELDDQDRVFAASPMSTTSRSGNRCRFQPRSATKLSAPPRPRTAPQHHGERQQPRS